MHIKYRKNVYFDMIEILIMDDSTIKNEIESKLIDFVREKNILDYDHIDILNITYLNNDHDYLVAIVDFAIIRG